MPKIRKAKSQSFRSRRSPSERRSPNNQGSTAASGGLTLNSLTAGGNTKDKRSPLTPKSPVFPHSESKSPGSMSASMSRQGTLRASHRRKNSNTGSLVLSQGRRSPVGLNDRSPSGRRSPLLKSPIDMPTQSSAFGTHSPTARSPTGADRRSPTFSIHTQERRSPIGAAAPYEFGQRKSPTSNIHVQEVSYETTGTDAEDFSSRNPLSSFTNIKRPSINLFTPIHFSGDKRSPVTNMPIPPITVSNPSETYKLAESNAAEASKYLKQQRENELGSRESCDAKDGAQPEKKERTSVMKEILAFVRKPSKHISTRANRFANAFTRAESGSSSGPLIRQSTFSASPAASSTAAKSAVVKQMSEVGFEPKMSLKFGHYAKMSLKLRRSNNQSSSSNEESSKTKPTSSAASSKRPSKDSNAGNYSDSGQLELQPMGRSSGAASEKTSPMGDLPFELANIRFEKVGESYIKHESKRTVHSTTVITDCNADDDGSTMASFVDEVSNSLKLATLLTENSQAGALHFTRRSESREPIEPRISEERESDSNDLVIPEDFRAELVEILKVYKPEPLYVNLQELKKETDEAEAAANAAAAAAAAGTHLEKSPLQCPIIEFEPPSRRSSFNPPRSPFLRSPGGSTTETDLMQRLDSGGDSFEMVDGDRKSSRGESSFEYPYSSRDTSFDISRYQSTSYEDQTSSFEIVDMDDKKKSNFDLRKSSIEMVENITMGRKSSLETHFDYNPSDLSGHITPARSPNFPMTKAQKGEHFRSLHISPFSAFSRARSPLSNQTSSNYSSRDSYDSTSSSHPHTAPAVHAIEPVRSPYGDPSKKHFPLTIKHREEEVKTFLCTDQRCASIFEPRPNSVLTQQLSTGSMSTPSGYGNGTPRANSSCGGGYSSGHEFEPPTPRRAASASPKHTFTFRIVLKKVDSSPEALCPEKHRSRIIDRYRRRDSRRKRMSDAGKSF